MPDPDRYFGNLSAEEEERKRRERLGIAGAPLPKKPPKKSNVKAKQAEVAELRSRGRMPQNQQPRIDSQPRQYFDDVISRARQQQKERKTKNMSPLQEYFHFSNQYGGQKQFAKRLQAVEDIWESYMKPFNGQTAIWKLATSAYTEDQIETMVRYGNLAYFGVPQRTQQAVIAAKAIKERGGDPLNPRDVQWAKMEQAASRKPPVNPYDSQLNKALYENARQLQLANYVGAGRDPEEMRKIADDPEYRREVIRKVEETDPWLAASIAALPFGMAGAGAVVAGLGLGATGSGAVYSAVMGAGLLKPTGTALTEELEQNERDREAERFVSELPHLAAANETPIPSAIAGIAQAKMSPVYTQVQRYREIAQSYEGADAVAAQKALQKRGIGKDLPADGQWSFEWLDRVTEAAQNEIGARIDWQRDAKELGWADHWAETDGNIDTPYWRRVANDINADGLAWEKLWETDPARAAKLETAGRPLTREGSAAFFRRMGAEGYPQMIYKAPLELAAVVGRETEAYLAAMELGIRKARDPGYLKAQNEFLDYIYGRVVADSQDDTWAGQPAREAEAVALAYGISQVEKGALVTDPKAQELYLNMRSEEARMVDEHYGPAYIVSAQHLVGRDYEKVEQFARTHPDLISATNVLTDLAVAVANPVGRARAATLGAKVGATSAAFRSSVRAQASIRRVTNQLWKMNHGEAAAIVKGTEAESLVQEVFGLKFKKMGKKKKGEWSDKGWEDRTLELDHKSVVVQRKAAQAVAALGAGEHLGPIFGNEAAAKIHKAAAGAKTRWRTAERKRIEESGERDSTPDVEGEEKAVREAVAKVIAKRQDTHKDVITKEDIKSALMDVASERWGGAKAADIFPFLRHSGVAPRRRIGTVFDGAAARVHSESARVFLSTVFGKPFHGAPLIEKEFVSVGTLNRVFDAAYHVSDDAKWAKEFRTRWVAASGNQRRLNMLEEELALKANERFVASEGLVGSLSDAAQNMKAQISPKRWEQGSPALAVDPSLEGKGASLSSYARDGETRQAVPGDAYRAYKARLHRSVLFAPYRTPADAGLLSRALYRTRNTGRFTTRTLTQGSRPLRQYTVAARFPLLFTKHALTDTSRTALEEGPWTVMSAAVGRTRSEFKKNMDNLDPEMRDAILHDKARAHASEAQWQIGNYEIVWTGKTMRVGKKGKVRDLDESAHALRRVVQDERYRIWAEGGEEALRAYFGTKEGRRWLAETGNIDFVKSQYMGRETAAPKGDALVQEAVESFLNRIMRSEWERLDFQMPNIMGVVKDMSLGRRTWDIDEIGKAIETFKDEDAYLSMPAEVKGVAGSPAGTIVGHAMYMNKWNRDVVYERVFNKTFRDLTKDGVDPNRAARIASSISEANVSRVHFDLANALSIEAKHRWFAWFATKHRLYATWIMKTALERPTLPAAAIEIKEWMERRNEQEGVSEFDKYDLQFDMPSWVPVVGGKTASINLGPMFWLADYPLESSIARVFEEQGFDAVNRVAGTDVVHASPDVFGFSMTAIDPLVTTTYKALKSPFGSKKMLPGGKDYTEGELREYIDGLDREDRDKLNRNISWQMAIAEANGEKIDIKVAYERAMTGSLLHELWALARPISMKFQGQATREVDVAMQQFFELSQDSPDEAVKMLQDNPALSWRLSPTVNVVDKERLIAGHRAMDGIRQEMVAKVDAAYEAGRLHDPDKAKELVDWYKQQVAHLTESQYEDTYNEVYAKWYNTNQISGAAEAFGLLLPLSDAKALYERGKENTEEEDNMLTEAADGHFDSMLNLYGLDPGDSGQLLYKILRRDEYYAWMAKQKGQKPEDFTSYRDEQMMKWLARGGKNGPYKADRYLELVRDKRKRDIIGKGFAGSGVPSKGSPFLGALSSEEKALIGWNADPSTEETWREWATHHWATRQYLKQNGVSATSKKGVAIWSNFERISEEMARKNPYWGAEWQFSRAWLHKRLEVLGVGSGTDKESLGWKQFLAIARDYKEELDSVWNKTKRKYGVGPTAQAATPVAQKFIPEVAKLAKDNPYWWEAFRSSYTLSKFGFYWERPEDEYRFLYWYKEDRPGEQGYAPDGDEWWEQEEME